MVTFTGTHVLSCASGATYSILFGPGHSGYCDSRSSLNVAIRAFLPYVFVLLIYEPLLDGVNGHDTLQIVE
jgi:hypothetical protein